MQLDSRVLDHREIPERELVVHRSEELNELDRLLGNTNGESAPASIYLLGPSGVGKTMTAQVSLRRAQEHIPLSSAYVNCWRYATSRDVLLQVVGATHPKAVHASSTPESELQMRLEESPEDPRIVILDEADQLQEPDVLYDLAEAPRTGVIAIANTEPALFQGVDKRIRSRFAAAHRLDFEPYDVTELTEILEVRVKYGIDQGDVEIHVLEEIAERADGDARVAIAALRIGAETAISENRDEILSQDVEGAVARARDLVREEHLERINDHQRVLFDIIAEREPIRTTELYEVYRERIDEEPRAERTLRDYLRKMNDYGLVRSTHNEAGKTWYREST